MNKLLIVTALLASGGFLSGCGSTSNNPAIEVPTVQEASGTNIDATTWTTIETTGTITTSTLTGGSSTGEIKSLIDKRKSELVNETGNKKELNEKDIQLLESVLNEMTKKK